MKKFLIILFLLIPVSNLYSQDFRVKITYTEGERSKDSYSKTITLSVNGLDAVRSTKTTGREGGLEMNENVTLGKADLQRIKTLEQELWPDKPLVASSTHYDSGQYRTIEVDVINKEDKKSYYFNGLLSESEKDETYKKFLSFYKEVDGLIECHVEK